MSSADPTGPDADTEAALPEPDVDRDALVLALRDELGAAVLESVVRPGVDAWVRVDPAAWVQAGEACRDRLGLRYFCFLSAIDWMPSPFGRSEGDGVAVSAGGPSSAGEPAADQRVAGGGTRFQLLARLVSPTTHLGLTLKADLPDEDLRVDSWTEVFAGADWHERETWEMFGIDFTGHPHLVHIYLPGEFEGYPLRKDFPLVARMVKPWPGIVDVEAMPGEASGDETVDAAEPT